MGDPELAALAGWVVVIRAECPECGRVHGMHILAGELVGCEIDARGVFRGERQAQGGRGVQRCGNCGSGWQSRRLVACLHPASGRYWCRPEDPACRLWSLRMRASGLVEAVDREAQEGAGGDMV